MSRLLPRTLCGVEYIRFTKSMDPCLRGFRIFDKQKIWGCRWPKACARKLIGNDSQTSQVRAFPGIGVGSEMRISNEVGKKIFTWLIWMCDPISQKQGLAIALNFGFKLPATSVDYLLAMASSSNRGIRLHTVEHVILYLTSRLRNVARNSYLYSSRIERLVKVFENWIAW